jgi:probable rRNA maturation factor
MVLRLARARSKMRMEVLNRQRKRRIPTQDLTRFGTELLPRVRQVARSVELPEQILVVLVSDRKIAQIHRQFMNMAGPTDVVTFQHGEVIISVDTAASQAADYGTSLLHELRLYLVHGLLHLAGYDDHSKEGFQEMCALQESLASGRSKLPDDK